MMRKATVNVEVRKMRILLFLSYVIAAAAPLSCQIGYPSNYSNFDEMSVSASWAS